MFDKYLKKRPSRELNPDYNRTAKLPMNKFFDTWASRGPASRQGHVIAVRPLEHERCSRASSILAE